MVTRDLSLLFIDDDLDFTRMVGDFVGKQYGHRAKLIPSVELAQKELARTSYDIIFLDYKLPGATGIEFLKWAEEKKLETPVIMLTGKGAEDIAVGAMKLGAYDYVSKVDLSLDYIPHLINNTYERFVLRKAQQELEAERVQRERREASAETYNATVRGLAHGINNELTSILLRVQSQQRKMAKQPGPVDPAVLAPVLNDVENSARVIEAVVASLVGLSAIITKKAGDPKSPVDIRKELEEAIHQIDLNRIKQNVEKGKK
ncbi:MAG TPA: response regulator [Bacteroidota bacterium]|nr:response regulator [Bacteroidota bacterium]